MLILYQHKQRNWTLLLSNKHEQHITQQNLNEGVLMEFVY